MALAACGSSATPAAAPPATKHTANQTTTSAAAKSSTSIATDGIDLAGTPGVTPAEQTRAQNLIRSTITDLRRFETPAEAYAAGYRSIGDAATGDEHYVNWSYVNDGHILDPLRPVSIVYEYRNGAQRAVAGDVHAAVRQHPSRKRSRRRRATHAVARTRRPLPPRTIRNSGSLSSLTSINGACPAGTSKAGDTPMLHVWAVPNSVCGPFAALEGIGAGQVPAGQTRRCDTRHASVP